MIVEVAALVDCERVDVFLSWQLSKTRTAVQRLIKSGNVKCDEAAVKKPSAKVTAGQKFTVDIPDSLNLTYLKADPVNFEVVYEDEHIFIINKPAGLVVHPAPGSWRNTLVNGLVYRYPEMRKLPNWLRPGIVHRLDGGTSGLMIVARTEKATLDFQRMFKDRTVSKHYIALVHGVPEQREGILSGPIDRDPRNFLRMVIIEGGKPSLTGYKVLWSMNGISLVECELFTGRTHQIRVHMSGLGCPLVGDRAYGAEDEGLGRVYLHSWRLEFTHPETGEAMKFRQPVTPDFLDRIANVKAGRPVDFREDVSACADSASDDYDDDFDGELDAE
ncbi:MAG: RluA family pseudouridine synthase [Synergistaceae bacterium]|nr:RluA family pseudouridine synthase [Synergistaceae bacterium]